MNEQEQPNRLPDPGVADSDDLGQVFPEQMRVRRAKREAMIARGEEPYPVALPVTTTIAQVRERFAGLEAGQESDAVVGLAGRVVYLRNTGKLCFVTLQDGAGQRIQAMFSQGEIGPDSLARFKADVDLGDHLFVAGLVISSKRGELSVLVGARLSESADAGQAGWRIAAKALRPLPTLHQDPSEEARVRHRSVDLIVRPAARVAARARVSTVRSLRESLHARDFAEIETPMLQTMHGGASARPFVTHMNAYDIDLYLRIAPELFLKRAVVGGFERVFEINRNFRNEGADSEHSPEFSMLEAYQAYGDYDSIATLTREIIQEAAERVCGTTVVTLADGSEYDLGGAWTELSMYPSLSQALGQVIDPSTAVETLAGIADRFEVAYDPTRASHGKLVEELWEHFVGSHLYAPTFVRDFPVETSPLTRDHRSISGVVEKWDLYVRGFELATGYSELVDPVIQRARFEAQAVLAAAGDDEAMRLDEDFLAAMEQGMPPAGGMGMGIDRLLMALTGLGIRETILFPLTKPIR